GWGGHFVVGSVDAGGVEPSCLRKLALRPREGGEQFQATAGGTARSLKKQFQALRVPAWQRGGPLLYTQGRLLFVPGLGIDARCRAADGVPQLGLRWQPG
ncbi:MAG: tRNA lysidine(34) synthetase TilS, partial [Rubrivivax sp.]